MQFSHICKEPLALELLALSNLSYLLCYKDNAFVFLSYLPVFITGSLATWHFQMRKAIFCVMESAVAVIPREHRRCLFRFLLCVWIASWWGILFSPAANGSPWHSLPGIAFHWIPSLSARKCHPNYGASELLLFVLPASGDTAHPYLSASHISHLGGLCQFPDPGSQRGEFSWPMPFFPKQQWKFWTDLFSPVGLPPLMINSDGIFHNLLKSHLRYFQWGVRIKASQ